MEKLGYREMSLSEFLDTLPEDHRARKEYCKLIKDLETERLRLAACGTAALGYFVDCAEEYKSASLHDALRLYGKYKAQYEVLSAIYDDIVTLYKRHIGEIVECDLCKALKSIMRTIESVQTVRDDIPVNKVCQGTDTAECCNPAR